MDLLWGKTQLLQTGSLTLAYMEKQKLEVSGKCLVSSGCWGGGVSYIVIAPCTVYLEQPSPRYYPGDASAQVGLRAPPGVGRYPQTPPGLTCPRGCTLSLARMLCWKIPA